MLITGVYKYLRSYVAVTPQHKTLISIPLGLVTLFCCSISLIRTLQTIYLIRKRHSHVQYNRQDAELTQRVQIPSVAVQLHTETTVKQLSKNVIEHSFSIQTLTHESSDRVQLPNQPSISNTTDIYIWSIPSNSQTHEAAQSQSNDHEVSCTRQSEEDSTTPGETSREPQTRQSEDSGNDLDDDIHQITKMLLTVSIIHTCTYLLASIARVTWPDFAETNLIHDMNPVLGFVLSILQNLHAMNFTINPIIYTVNQHFKKYCIFLFQRLTCIVSQSITVNL